MTYTKTVAHGGGDVPQMKPFRSGRIIAIIIVGGGGGGDPSYGRAHCHEYIRIILCIL